SRVLRRIRVPRLQQRGFFLKLDFDPVTGVSVSHTCEELLCVELMPPPALLFRLLLLHGHVLDLLLNGLNRWYAIRVASYGLQWWASWAAVVGYVI
ncbi:hypothetical protein Dimus_028976, partial [Dionaea muscipula]